MCDFSLPNLVLVPIQYREPTQRTYNMLVLRIRNRPLLHIILVAYSKFTRGVRTKILLAPSNEGKSKHLPKRLLHGDLKNRLPKSN